MAFCPLLYRRAPYPRSVDRTNAQTLLDRAIRSLQQLREALEEPGPVTPPKELYGRYIDAPVWPWFWAGWTAGALIVLMFVVAWIYGRG